MSIQGDKQRNKELGMIHIAIKQLGMDEETYRSMLFTVARVRSSKDLDYGGRRAVLEHLAGRGFKKQTKPQVTQIKKPLIGKIEALLADMKLPWSYAEGIAKQMFKRSKLEWCNAQELRAIVAALAKRQSKTEDQHG